jgi:integrase
LIKLGVGRLGLDAKRFGGHSMRSGFATAASIAGTGEAAIMGALGHRTLEMTIRYVRSSAGL